jgi:hypothetical protein
VTFVASGSRGPVLGLVVGLVVFSALTLREPGARRRLVLLAGGAVVAALLVPQFVPGQNLGRTFGVLIGDTGAGKGDLSNGRFALWGEAWHAFTAHPLLGIGTGGFAGNEPLALYPHNMLLEFASELGIVGVLLVLGIVGYTGLTLVRLSRRGPVEDRFQLAFVAASFVAAVVNASFSGDVNFNSAVWLTSGLAIGLARRVAPETGDEQGRWARRLRRKAEPEDGVQPRASEPGSSPGAIVSPPHGSTVSGAVQVSAEPAQTGWTVAALAIEAAADGGGWAELEPAPSEEAYEIALVSRGAVSRRRRVTVVHSRERAEQLKAVLDAEHDGGPERVEIMPAGNRRSDEASWDTSAVADGPYRLRAVTTDIAGHRVESPEVAVEVRNQAASAEPEEEPLLLEARPDALGGTVELRARPNRPYEIEWVAFQAASTGSADWQTIAQVEEPPFVAFVDTTRLADGLYDFRALAGREDGRVDCSRPVRSRQVENAAEAVTEVVPPIAAPPATWLLEPPAGSVATGTVSLTAAAEGQPPLEVAFECSLDGREWFELGVTAAAPYACAWDTTAAPNGDYWLRSAVYDASGRGAAGAPVQVRVANEAAIPLPVPALTYHEVHARLLAADPARSEALLGWLRAYVGPEGTIPEAFSGLVSEALRDLGV